MDNFIVSARKYRPATFNTVVGQGHITNTLKNAIKTGHLAQAFLFCGPRGVGKTTCARILAKTINCTNRTEDTEACDTCESCESFKSGSSLNVFELDAASNNGVDDIRSLIEQVRYAPQLGAYKVYVIDEVHMLSTPAFNAFLKTLEEPPKHAIFILATTEKHKIIPTILSRCQIFDFNRIQIEDIANHLAYIAKSENVTAEPDALHLIAQKADGALRDACSIFDQIVSFAGNNVTYKAVIDNLNILDYDYYFKMTDAILAENISSSLLLFNEILNNGFDGHNFVAGMGDHFRNLLVSKDPDTIQLLEVGTNIKAKYKEQSTACSLSFLVRGLALLNKTDIGYKASKNQRLQVELALMQLCSGSVDTEKKKELIKEPAQATQATTQTTSSTAVPSTSAPAKQNTAPAVTPSANAATNNTASTSSGIKKPFIKTTTTSISSIINPEKKTEVASSVSSSAEPAVQKQVSQNTLEEVWNIYANGLKAKGKLGMAAGLLRKMPTLTNGNIVEFSVNNKALEESIDEDKINIIGFLRQQLNNSSLQLKLILTNEEDKTSLYTATDRYKHLVEKNPNINKFRQAFDLDVEF